MDPLSDVLSLLQARSLLSSRLEGYGRWRLRFPADAAPQIKFGGVFAGTLHIALDGAKRAARLETGDFYLMTQGRAFTVASDPTARVLDGVRVFRGPRDEDGIVRVGEAVAGEHCALASGRFLFDDMAAPLLLRHLPPLVHLRGSAPGAASLAALLELLRSETGAAAHGAAIARTSLATLILVQALRVFLAESKAPAGWLRALADARIGPALAAVHADVARPWTVQALADAAGMSRSAFALHFRSLAGTTPLDHLQQWRLALAQRALEDSDEPVARIAERVGYLSDTAFSAAFKRTIGESPGRFRQSVRVRRTTAAGVVSI